MPGDDQRSNLYPDAELFVKSDRLQNRLQSRPAHSIVELLRETLQVDIRRMQDRRYRFEGFGSDIPVRDKNVLESRSRGCLCCVIGKFEVDGRFRVGVGNAR